MELMDGELPSSPGELPLWWFPTPHLNLSVYPSLEARVCDRCLLMVQDKVGVMKVGWELARGWTVNKEEWVAKRSKWLPNRYFFLSSLSSSGWREFYVTCLSKLAELGEKGLRTNTKPREQDLLPWWSTQRVAWASVNTHYQTGASDRDRTEKEGLNSHSIYIYIPMLTV